MQICQPANDCILDDEDVARVSRKNKSSDADVMSQVPKSKNVACSVDGEKSRAI